MSEARVGVVIIWKLNHRFFLAEGGTFSPGKSILFVFFGPALLVIFETFSIRLNETLPRKTPPQGRKRGL
ncbi:MAG: hypothetical protein GYA67_08720 [Smithella sp.]|jgi:hypothetical protein|nr:hypothetical protein [Smithella sp.]